MTEKMEQNTGGLSFLLLRLRPYNWALDTILCRVLLSQADSRWPVSSLSKEEPPSIVPPLLLSL